jgi:hypothetical protein
MGGHMVERTKGSGPDRNGLRTEPVTSFSDTSRSTSGDQFHLPSQPNSDQPSDLISNRDTDLAFSESISLMVQFGESGASENIDKRWESDRRRLEKWSIAAKMTVFAMVAIAIMTAIAIPFFFEDNQPFAHEIRQQIVVPKETATETALAVARQSSEPLLASAERNRPQHPTNRLNSGLTPDDTAANTKSVGQDQVPSTQALAATQRPAKLIDKEELANLLKRGHYFLSIGDIAPARLLLERAADAHDASAAFDLAGTYDPAVLTRSHVSGIAPDLAMARMWYQKALELGHSEAEQRLAQLQK